jgi:hypothetical protein
VTPPGKEPAPPAKEPVEGQPVPEPAPEGAATAEGAGAFAQAPTGGAPPAAAFNPAQFGEFMGPWHGQSTHTSTVNLGLGGGTSTVPTSTQVTSSAASLPQTNLLAPVLTRGAFKIADNDSPMPQNRVAFNYNFFSDVNVGSAGTADLHRETVGFELAFLDNNASVEVRLPFVQLEGNDLTNVEGMGDLTIIGKYALINDRETGNVLSAGLGVTVPTGRNDLALAADTVHDTLLQPFVGYIVNCDKAYLSGFSSLVVPTDSRDSFLWFNDIAVGYWAYRCKDPGAVLKAVVPTFETHITTPLTHRGLDNPSDLGVPDWVTLTAGAHVFCGRLEMGAAVGTPVTGPRPYDLEVLAHLNIHF